MGSIPENASSNKQHHLVCISFPAQGHINPTLKLAKLLHQQNFHITFVLTEYNHRRLVKSRGPSAVAVLPDFRFATIPDGLPATDADATQDIPSLCVSTPKACVEPFCELIERLNNSDGPPVTGIVSDGGMSFTIKAAERFDLPVVFFWTLSACGVLAYKHYQKLVDQGYAPLKDLSPAVLNTVIDWIPGMKDMKLRDIPSFIRTTEPKDSIMLHYFIHELETTTKGKGIIINTFDALEKDVIDSLSNLFPRVYTVGPLQLMHQNHIHDESLKTIDSSLWKVDSRCIDWLDTKEPSSVVYVNFGSITVMTPQQMTEFAWGLANSKKHFLWIIRPDLVVGEKSMLSEEFVAETKDRGMMINWCNQEQVLKHPAVGCFLTHSGWNSTLESIVGGVPVICWPFFAEQQTNCRYCCVEWEMGMEIDNDVKREEVEAMVKEMMDGEKGKKMKEKAVDWKKKAYEAAEVGGSSYSSFNKMIKEVFLQ